MPTAIFVFIVGTSDGFYRAWNILVGVESPFKTANNPTAGAPGLILSALGWLVAPTLIGGAAAALVDRAVKRRDAPSKSTRAEMRQENLPGA